MRLERLNPGNVVLPAGATTLSKAIHDGKYIILSDLTGHTVTLPPATGSGCHLTLVETVAPTSNSNIVKVANGDDVMIGSLGITNAGGTNTAFPTAATSDTVTLNRTTSGGASNGGVMEFIDIALNKWLVEGRVNGSGSGTTPFSATVS